MVLPYQGGKQKFRKGIYNTMIKYIKKNNIRKYELLSPFCGMLAVELEFAQKGIHVRASDVNIDVIKMWKALQGKWKPNPYCSLQEYTKLKNSKKHSAQRGFCLSTYSFGGIFGHYSVHKYRDSRVLRKRGYKTYQKLLNVKPYLKNFKFSIGSYTLFKPHKNEIVYCDPPYASSVAKSTSGNKYLDKFDHDKFWETMRKWSKNNLVFISEELAPNDFKCVWKKNVVRTIGSIAGSSFKKTEKLFIHKSWL
jgi:DNA adenine methylase